MLKLKPHQTYPVESGRYLRGNDFSPVALAVVLNTYEDKIPVEIDRLVKAGFESGTALSGTVQTTNIGFEKMIVNIIGNPNIRYLILAGPESAGFLTGEALTALFENGVDEKKKIIGTDAMSAHLYNIPKEYIERFRRQIALVDAQFKDEETVRTGIKACFQENPVAFLNYSLYDPGAFAEPFPEIINPISAPVNDKEAEAKQKALDLMSRLKNMNKGIKN